MQSTAIFILLVTAIATVIVTIAQIRLVDALRIALACKVLSRIHLDRLIGMRPEQWTYLRHIGALIWRDVSGVNWI